MDASIPAFGGYAGVTGAPHLRLLSQYRLA